VLPEMFSTGFSMNSKALAEDNAGATVEWLRTQAKRLGAAVTGSFIAEDGGKYYNRLVWMFPEGNFATYDKRHLFTYAREDQSYSAGDKRLVVEYLGWRICPLVCYDLRFPVWSRNDGREDGKYYDVLIYVANWPAPRMNAWKSLLPARAIENQAYVVGVNRVGEDGSNAEYLGNSCIIDFMGKMMASKAGIEATRNAVLDWDLLSAFRKRFRFLNDKDGFVIQV